VTGSDLTERREANGAINLPKKRDRHGDCRTKHHPQRRGKGWANSRTGEGDTLLKERGGGMEYQSGKAKQSQ